MMRLVSIPRDDRNPRTNSFIDYTSPVFFWTNIELSLAVISGCLPTLRPIWTHLRLKKPSSQYLGNRDYELGNRDKQSELYTELQDVD
jgi:hypothetical protein